MQYQVYVNAETPSEGRAKALAWMRQHHAEKIRGQVVMMASAIPTPGIGQPGLRVGRRSA